MKKGIIIVTILMLILGLFLCFSNTYAAKDKAIDNTTESKIVELKENASNSMEDYKEKYRVRYIWNSSIYFEHSAYL